MGAAVASGSAGGGVVAKGSHDEGGGDPQPDDRRRRLHQRCGLLPAGTAVAAAGRARDQTWRLLIIAQRLRRRPRSRWSKVALVAVLASSGRPVAVAFLRLVAWPLLLQGDFAYRQEEDYGWE